MKKLGTVQKIIIAAATVLPLIAWFSVYMAADRDDNYYMLAIYMFLPVYAIFSLDLFTLLYSAFYAYNNKKATDMLHLSNLVVSSIQTAFTMPFIIDFTVCGMGLTEKFIMTGWLLERTGAPIVFRFSVPVAVVIVVIWLLIIAQYFKRNRKTR